MGVHKVLLQLKKSLFVLFFSRLFDLQKNFVKHIEKLLQHLSEKFIGDNLSITNIALRNLDLSIIRIAQSFFEIIDYRFSTERFILPITAGICRYSSILYSEEHSPLTFDFAFQ